MDKARRLIESPFSAKIAEEIWNSKYRWKDGSAAIDATVADTWRRTARHLASIEKDNKTWREKFYDALAGFHFLPGGRILANAGTGHRATLFNCFVMGHIDDSIDGIFDALKEGALTMQQGGGVGYDFSSLRPRGMHAEATGRVASGPVSFMKIWNTMCATILTTGARRGAMIATLRCDHPDILEFVTAKHRPGELSHFNISVLVTDEFMQAVEHDRQWNLVFAGEVIKTIRARDLWSQILRSTYDHAEPGVLFIDRINHLNNLGYAENISATNPCGEIPLPAYGACDLGSINLTQFVENPFTSNARFSRERLLALIPTAVRMLDNVIDSSHFPLPAQKAVVMKTRRVGLGITGLADALAMLNLDYRTHNAREFAGDVMRMICYEAYATSIALAKEKGPFAGYVKDKFLAREFIKKLPENLQNGIREHGVRNSHLVAIAPTGTISLLANNVSSGIEPIFQTRYTRRILQLNGEHKEQVVSDYAAELWWGANGDKPLPSTFVTAHDVSPRDQLLMQAALQPYVDNSISKTINVAEDFPFEKFADIYDQAYKLGLKGCTTFRNNPTTGHILASLAKS